jgi:membrane protease YdiL (CAAX protease family)
MLPLGFMLMMASPWLLLNKEGRRQIGLRAPSSLLQYPTAVLCGVAAALACFAIGVVLFGEGGDNWFVSVASNYRATMDTSRFSAAKLYLIFTLPALLFSPIGEEIFFRGMLQRSLEDRLSVNASTFIESAAFGIVHLCHHGLALDAAGLTVRPVSGALWVVLMSLVAWMLAGIRKRSGSLYPAMASHAAFNATMNWVIFAFLWK